MSNKTEKKIETPIGVVITPAPTRTLPKRRRVQLFTGSETPTEQSHKEDCDINNIVARYGRDELAEFVQNDSGAYLNLADAPSYQEALNLQIEANHAFERIPSAIRREQFGDSVERFLAFASNPKNMQKMVDLGLATRRPIIDPPASRGDIEKLTTALKADSKRQPAGGPKDE